WQSSLPTRRRARQRGVPYSLQSGDDLVSEAKIDLGRAKLLPREILLDGRDLGEAFHRDVLHGADGLLLQLEQDLVAAPPRPADGTDACVERGHRPLDPGEQAEQSDV